MQRIISSNGIKYTNLQSLNWNWMETKHQFRRVIPAHRHRLRLRKLIEFYQKTQANLQIASVLADHTHSTHLNNTWAPYDCHSSCLFLCLCAMATMQMIASSIQSLLIVSMNSCWYCRRRQHQFLCHCHCRPHDGSPNNRIHHFWPYWIGCHWNYCRFCSRSRNCSYYSDSVCCDSADGRCSCNCSHCCSCYFVASMSCWRCYQTVLWSTTDFVLCTVLRIELRRISEYNI